MVIKFKKLSENAVAPVRANPLDAGWDLTARWHETDNLYGIVTYGTGIAVAIPEGYVGLLFPRSSIYKMNAVLVNSVGVIDPGYKGEIMFKFAARNKSSIVMYLNGDRIGQLIIMPIADVFFDETQELPDSERGTGGFGSSDILSKLSS